jgi:hypothetical protein
MRHPAQQHLPQQEIQKRALSVQAPSSSNSDVIKVATLVQQIRTELSEAVTEKDKMKVITKMVRNLLKQNGCQRKYKRFKLGGGQAYDSSSY